MKALTFYGIRDLRYEEVENPKIEKDTDVIVKVKAVGICGSDISRYKKLGPHTVGNVWGHEFSGIVSEVGSAVKHVKVGDHVVGNPTLVCGECEHCRAGHPSKCESLSVAGAFAPGAYAEYIKLPALNIVKMPDGMTFEEGALTEPSATVLHGLYQTNIQMGYEVAVIGCGNIGLLAIQWAKLFGAKKIYAIDINEKKLEVAKELGADIVINSKEKDPYEAIREYGDGVDLALESAGNPITAAQVLSLTKKGGEVMYLGIPYGDVNVSRFNFEKILRSELTVKGSWNCVSGPFPGKEWINAVELIGQKKIDVSKIITHKLSLSEGPSVFEQIVENPNAFGKVLFYPENI